MRSFLNPRPFLVLVMLLFLITFASAAGPQPVWLVSNGFHSSLALRAADAPRLAALDDDPTADHVLIGWGHRAFYQRQINVCTTLSAVLWANRSILHIIPFSGPARRRFAHSDVIRFDLSASQYQQLVAELERSFDRDRRGRVDGVARGYFQGSRFYASRETFWLRNMCNAWVARKLRASGVPIPAESSTFATGLARAAATLGRREQSRKRPADAF